ncbi:MAG TPA: 8-amino-7-oxononanoate synthase, partial [Clostridia bacterium]|nr:8-amino-7-oxononanoate synthase [Clostridia bacterium]
MDIFDKCFKYEIVDEIRQKGIYPFFHTLQSRQDVEVIMEGKRKIMLGSNNYLGLTTNENVVKAG